MIDWIAHLTPESTLRVAILVVAIAGVLGIYNSLVELRGRVRLALANHRFQVWAHRDSGAPPEYGCAGPALRWAG